MRIRMRINSQAVIKLAALVSNSITLSTNAYLLGVNVRRQIKQKKTEEVAERLQLASEVAQAITGLSRVVINALESHNAEK